MRKPNLRPLLLGFLFLVLCLPMLQHWLGIVESGKLYGDVRNTPDTVFTIDHWWDGSYQQHKTDYLNDNTGFRPDLVRLNNQVDYSLFGKLHARSVVEGKGHYFYEEGYINSYFGLDYAGDSAIQSQLGKLKFIQDTLERAGKHLLLVFAPSKGRFYPEYFPEEKKYLPPRKSNYTEMLRAAQSMGIHELDLNGYFLQMKRSSPHALFSRQGIHWTRYGATYAADTLNKVLEGMLHMDLPDMEWKVIDCSNTPRDGDDDIVRGLNLIWPVTTEEFCYPAIYYRDDSTKSKPRVIYISDSFFWTLISREVPQHTYSYWECWFYFNEIWNNAVIEGKTPIVHTADTDWFARLQQTDVLVIMLTEINLSNLGNGFVDQAYDKFKGKGTAR